MATLINILAIAVDISKYFYFFSFSYVGCFHLQNIDFGLYLLDSVNYLGDYIVFDTPFNLYLAVFILNCLIVRVKC